MKWAGLRIFQALAIALALAAPPGLASSASPNAEGTKGTGQGVQVALGFSYADPWASLRQDCLVDQYSDTEPAQIVRDETKISTSSTASPSSSEPTPPVDTFVSFEEWKRLKEAEENDQDGEEDEESVSDDSGTSIEESPIAGGSEQDSTTSGSSGARDASRETGVEHHVRTTSDGSRSNGQRSTTQAVTSQANSKTGSSSSSTHASSQSAPASPPPHHHNRYNYASPDCSARIHSSSPQTQHASSLLHKSRDRYMLTPCKAKEHWVVVELCDEIRVEALEVAVWEFFSGVVREVKVSVGGEDEEDQEDNVEDGGSGKSSRWTEVGSFIGRNIRGAQTFTLSQPTSFHRFIRLDFPTYYGTEYYCPVSQLKVYGMNQMEAFKWEQKRSSASNKEKDRDRGLNRDREAEERRARERERKEREEREKQQIRENELDALERLLHEQAGRTVSDVLTETALLSRLTESVSTASPSSLTPASSIRSTTSGSPLASDRSSSSVDETANSTVNISSASAISPVSSSTSKVTTEPPSSSTTYSRSSPPKSDSSESIYAFIIRRLNALEGNSTLVARYIEEQAKVMRQMLGRVERNWDEWKAEWDDEERSRWEQERMRQEDRLGRVVSQFEQQRLALEVERHAIQTQLRVLADELGYERRRGLAQLFIMFIIIILGVATRSSSIDALLKPLLAEAKRRRSMRKSFSGPLAGLRIDMGSGRPPAVIGQARPQPRSDDDADGDEGEAISRPFASPTPTPNGHAKRGSTGRNNSISRRPGTPNTIRQRRLPPGIVQSGFRSVSAVDTGAFSPVSLTGHGATLHSPKPRGSLPAFKPGAAPRRLARSAHLHTMEADKVRHDLKVKSRSGSIPVSDMEPDSSGDRRSAETYTPRRPKSALMPPLRPDHVDLSHSPALDEISPFTRTGLEGDGVVPDPLPVEDGPSEWGTDAETELDASASEVEDEVERSESERRVLNRKDDQLRRAHRQEEAGLVDELKQIWKGTGTNDDTLHDYTP
ncbi:hypothetical protein IAU60_003932 [Kwoniella sp. DSM 27419]